MSYGSLPAVNRPGSVNGRSENKDRSRWYGIRPGDLVEERAFGMTRRGVVLELHATDNNGCTFLYKGKRCKAVPEWCTIIERVENRG